MAKPDIAARGTTGMTEYLASEGVPSPGLEGLGKPNGDKGIPHKPGVGGHLDTKGPLDLEAGAEIVLHLSIRKVAAKAYLTSIVQGEQLPETERPGILGIELPDTITKGLFVIKAPQRAYAA